MSNVDFLEKDQKGPSNTHSNNNVNVQKENLPNWAVNYAVSKYSLDVDKVNLNVVNSSQNLGFKGMAIGNNIFIDEKYKNNKTIIKHEIAHIYQQALGKVDNANSEELENEAIKDSESPISTDNENISNTSAISNTKSKNLAPIKQNTLISPNKNSTSIQFFNPLQLLPLITPLITLISSISEASEGKGNKDAKNHKEQILYDMKRTTYNYSLSLDDLEIKYSQYFKCFSGDSINKITQKGIDIYCAERFMRTVFFFRRKFYHTEKMFEPYVDDFLRLYKAKDKSNKDAESIRSDLKNIGYYGHLEKERKRIMDVYIYMLENMDNFDINNSIQNMYNLFEVKSKKPKNIWNKENAELYVSFYKGTNGFNGTNINDIKKSKNIFKVLDTRQEPKDSFEKKNSANMVRGYSFLGQSTYQETQKDLVDKVNLGSDDNNNKYSNKLSLLFSDVTDGFTRITLNELYIMFNNIYGVSMRKANIEQLYSFITLLQYYKEENNFPDPNSDELKSKLDFCSEDPIAFANLVDITSNFKKRSFDDVRSDISSIFTKQNFKGNLLTRYSKLLFSTNFFDGLDQHTIDASAAACSHILPSFSRLLAVTDNFKNHSLGDVEDDMRDLNLGNPPYNSESHIIAYEKLALLTNFFKVRAAYQVYNDFTNLYTGYVHSPENILHIYKDYEHIFIKTNGSFGKEEDDYDNIIIENKKSMDSVNKK